MHCTGVEEARKNSLISINWSMNLRQLDFGINQKRQRFSRLRIMTKHATTDTHSEITERKKIAQDSALGWTDGRQLGKGRERTNAK